MIYRLSADPQYIKHWGYITREPDHHDGRGRVIHLTDRGEELMRTIRSIHAEVESSWIAQLGQRKFAALRDTLTQITQHHALSPTQ